jgi:hypothetical protein
MAEPVAPQTPQPRYADEAARDGMNRMRETAKWLILAFGVVVNSFILTGIGLADLADVDSDNLPVALVALLAAVIAVVIAVLSASLVLQAGQVTLTDLKDDGPAKYASLRAEINRNEDLFPGYDSIEQFAADMTAAAQAQVENARPLYEGTGDESNKSAYLVANEKVRTMRPLSDRLLLTAAFHEVRNKLNFHRWVIAACFAAVVVAAAAFALAVGEKEGSAAARAEPLTAVTANLTPAGEQRFGAALGERCDTDDVQALLVGGSDGQVDLVATRQEGCRPAALEISPELGSVEPMRLPTLELP